MLKKSLTAVTLVFALFGNAQAEDAGGGDGGGQLEYVAFDPSQNALEHSSPLSCREARATAWFERELKRSDGEVNPEAQAVACGGERLAEVTSDSD